MPVEVIDLVSSPEVALPPRRTGSTVSQAQSRPKPPARRLDYDEDIFDLTGFTDDAPLPAPRQALKRPSPQASRKDGVPFLSDDFDIEGDMFDASSDPFEARESKKPRLTAESGGRAGNTNRTVQKSKSTADRTTGCLGVLQPTSLSRLNTTADPIQTSSDPFASSPHHTEKVIIDLSRDDDLDPFASFHTEISESKKQVPSKPVTKQAALSSQLFVSSPPRNEAPPKARTKAPVTKNPVRWDHISSSAPETSFRDDGDLDLVAQLSRRGLGRSCSDGMDPGDLADFPMSSDDDFPDINNLRPTKFSSKNFTAPRTAGSKRSSSSAKKTTVEKELERLDKAAAREADKRRKEKEKKEAKERKAREKERAAALAEVNKVRTDKKVSTPEMIVDLPISLKPSTRLQIETLLDDLSVQHYSYSSPANNVVKWRRKVKARFNEDEGQWEPIPERVEAEKHAIVLMPAAEFVELALGAKGSDIEAHILKMQRHHEDYKFIYLIEGLTSWMRKNRQVRNRQFQSAVRNDPAPDDPSAPPANSQSRRKRDPKPPPVYIDEDVIEDALLQLQVLHGVLIHHAAAPVETAQWVAVFTQHISTIPYRRQKDAVNSSAAFCMESGQVRTGDGPQDTYVRMLQEIVRVTAPIAYGIASEYPTVTKLVRGLEQEGPLVLEGIRKSANKDGAFSDRTIGQAVSKRIWKVFLGRDETSTDI